MFWSDLSSKIEYWEKPTTYRKEKIQRMETILPESYEMDRKIIKKDWCHQKTLIVYSNTWRAWPKRKGCQR